MPLETIILLSFLFTSIAGVAFHFAHKKFPKNLLVHIFCPVNESVWEHTKLTFSPMFIAAIFQVFAFNSAYPNHFLAILMSIVAGIVLVPVLYYPIRAIVGKEVLWVSIGLFYVVVICAYLVEYSMLKNNTSIPGINLEIVSICLTISLIFSYAVLTFFPPKWGIFKDSIKKKYGDFR
jgi:hypothetical protein